MSVVPMKLLTLAGPLEQFDQVVRCFVLDQDFHPENALSLMSEVQGLMPLEGEDPYAPLLRRGEELAQRAGLALEYAPFEEKGFTLQQAQQCFDRLEGALAEHDQEAARLASDEETSQQAARQLEHLRGIGANLDELWSLEFARFRYGYLPREAYDSFQETLNGEEDILFVPTTVGQHRVYGVYFTTRAGEARVDALFNSIHFTRVDLGLRPHGSVEEAVAELEMRAGRDQTDLEKLETDLAGLREREGAQLLAVCAWLRYESQCRQLRGFACRSRESFYLMGWVPVDQVEAVRRRVQDMPELSCVVDRAEEVRGAKPPTRLKNPFLGRVFQPFLEMYGLPDYHETDPSLFMAATYCLFFGIMFGDLGQGLCLALLGLVLAKWRGLWLGNIIACCGLSGALFGCVYGSVFGFEDILPGFKIMEQTTFDGLGVVSNVLLLLVLSIALGIGMLLVVMLINIRNGVRQHRFEKILFGPNGAAGVVFYAGLLLAALATLAFGVDLFTPAYVLPVLVLPLVLMLFREPLSRLLEGEADWRDFSLGQVLGVGLFELFETLLSYLTNTLSFLRVGAYAVTHVGLMLVVHMLADMAGGVGGPAGIVILVLGNAFVMGFEGLLVGIQVLRLEFYELFGRFYDDGGVPFTPRTVDYTGRGN